MIKFINRNISYISTLTILLFFTPLFYYSFQYIRNIWAFSNAFINYSYGFVRRGLLGELFTQISISTNFPLRKIILYFLFIIFIIYYFFIYQFFKSIKIKPIFIFCIFSPLFLIFPVAELEALGRKDILILLFSFISINLSIGWKSPAFR